MDVVGGGDGKLTMGSKKLKRLMRKEEEEQKPTLEKAIVTIPGLLALFQKYVPMYLHHTTTYNR